MTVTIYGLLGHAGKLELPLDSLEVEELAPGEEFMFGDRLYQIRSVSHVAESVQLNVSLVTYHAFM